MYYRDASTITVYIYTLYVLLLVTRNNKRIGLKNASASQSIIMLRKKYFIGRNFKILLYRYYNLQPVFIYV